MGVSYYFVNENDEVNELPIGNYGKYISKFHYFDTDKQKTIFRTVIRNNNWNPNVIVYAYSDDGRHDYIRYRKIGNDEIVVSSDEEDRDEMMGFVRGLEFSRDLIIQDFYNSNPDLIDQIVNMLNAHIRVNNPDTGNLGEM